jgi:hypothetical protein
MRANYIGTVLNTVSSDQGYWVSNDFRGTYYNISEDR